MTTWVKGGDINPVATCRYWAADNGRFSEFRDFDLDKYVYWLKRFSPYKDKCLFVTAPDAMGDPDQTLADSLPALPVLTGLGYKTAFVIQDGCTEDKIPWDLVDVIFIGGTVTWKFSDQVKYLTQLSKSKGKNVHMGRVNSYKRFKYAFDIGCDYTDGTFLKFGPRKNIPQLLRWFEKLDEYKLTKI